MAITPEEIRNKTFSIHRRGYDQQEVSRYLAAIADDLAQFNASMVAEDEAPSDDIIVAEVVPGETNESSSEDATEVVAEEISTLTPEPAPSTSMQSFNSDEFDRVGTEISVMLRQAQESALKIRSDAESEARTLVDQIRLDIEADRLAHEQAAGELITRTEERAAEIRTEAEDYSNQTRTTADSYAVEVREQAESDRIELTASVEADRTLAADKLNAASEDAEATLAEAKREAEEIRRQAQADAKAEADEMLETARRTLTELVDAEKVSKQNLEEARSNIENTLSNLRLTSVSDSSLGIS